jgi:NAD-dependent SIR2 family protein deacetylase
MQERPAPLDLSGLTTVRDALKQIGDELARRDVGFLFGAGMSHDSGVPLASRVSDHLLRETFTAFANAAPDTQAEVAAKLPFEVIAATVEQRHGRHRTGLVELVGERLDLGSRSPNAGHSALSSICARTRLPLVFTTNWDLLIERELGKGFRCLTITEDNAHDISDNDPTKLKVVHLHGLMDGAMKATEDDVLDDSVLLAMLSAHMLTQVFIIVGHSMSDFDLRSIFLRVRQTLKQKRNLGKETYVVAPVWSEAELEVATAAWATRGCTLIPLTATQFMVLLDQQLSKQEAERRKRLAAQVADIMTPDELDFKVRSMTAVFEPLTEDAVVGFLEATLRAFPNRGREADLTRGEAAPDGEAPGGSQ